MRFVIILGSHFDFFFVVVVVATLPIVIMLQCSDIIRLNVEYIKENRKLFLNDFPSAPN